MATPLPKVSFDGQLMAEDMASQGIDGALALWNLTNRRVAHKTICRFLSGEVQSTRTARVLAAALGFEVERYVIRSRTPQTLAS